MAKVILVQQAGTTGPITFRSNLLREPSEYVVIASGSESDRREALAAIVEDGDEVFVMNTVKNCEGVAAHCNTASVLCIHGIRDILHTRLTLNEEEGTAYDIVSTLARDLRRLEMAG